ncbi:MAG: radical SAM protein [Clostridia bacterium]|nr:radical SAM protein [Clostridia bacterium]
MKKRFAKIYLEITNRCNLRCSFCHGTKRAPRTLTPEEFRTLAQRLVPYTDYLYLHVLGEPLMHPELETLLDTSATLGFRTCITTNGTLLRKRQALLLAHAEHLGKVSISLHSAEGSGVPVDAYLGDALDSAAALSAAGVVTVLRLWNLGEGGENTQNDTILAALHARFPEPWAENRRGTTLAPSLYLEWGERFDWPDLSATDYGEVGACYGMRDHIAVLSDGTVIPCCLDSEGDIALGNLFDSELADILASPRAVTITEGFRRRRAVEPLCRRCGYAQRFV